MAIRRDGPTAGRRRRSTRSLERFDGFAAVRILPKTGRTHQIRVHLGHIGCPVLCDRQYGGRARITRGEIRRDPADDDVLLERQALHARRLRLLHPATGKPLEVEAPLPGRHRRRARSLAPLWDSARGALMGAVARQGTGIRDWGLGIRD